MKYSKFFTLIFFFLITGLLPSQAKHDSLDQAIVELRALAGESPERATTGLLETKKKAEKLKYPEGVMKSSYTLMLLYYNGGDYGKVIEESRDTEKAAKTAQDVQYLADVYRMRAISYDETGLGKEALTELNKALPLVDKIKPPHILHYKKALIYESYAGIYSKKKEYQKEIDYRYKSVAESFKMPETPQNILNAKYHNLALQYNSLALVYNDLGKKDSTAKYFDQALNIFENPKYDIYANGKTSLLSDMATFYNDNKESRKAIRFAKEAESFEKQTTMPYIRRDIYKTLYNAYSELHQNDSVKYYLDLYTELNDSLTLSERENILAPVKQIISDKESEKKSALISMMSLAGLFILGIVIIGYLIYQYKNKQLHKKYETIIEQLKSDAQKPVVVEERVEEKPEETSPKSIQISDDTVKSLLKRLEEFETRNKFTQKEVSFAYLSNYLGTNSKYLTEILKQYKNKSFSQYINDLRIDYIVKRLYEEPKYREYKISYLAEECGFASREVFTSAFKKKTGISPSYFIQNLRKKS